MSGVNKFVQFRGHEIHRDADEERQATICMQPGAVVEMSDTAADRLIASDGAKFVEMEFLGLDEKTKQKKYRIVKHEAPAPVSTPGDPKSDGK